MRSVKSSFIVAILLLSGIAVSSLSTLQSASAVNVTGTSADEHLKGTSGHDNISGEGGNDFIQGFAGPDNLSGGDGNDKIFGGAGDDRLSGGNGNDRLIGGPGNDILTGGPGADSFNCGAGNDIVQDFSSEEGDSISSNCEVVRTPQLNWQYREHMNTAFSPDFVFTKESAGDKRLDIRSQGSESIGLANVFKVFKKSDILGRDIKVTWERSRDGPGTSQANIIVYDGPYNRASSSDFPNGSNEILKGGGILGRIIGSPAEGWSEKTDILSSSSIDYSKSKFEDVTLLIDSGDSQFSTNQFLEIRSVDISGYAKWSFEDPGITAERSGTTGDYGLITASISNDRIIFESNPDGSYDLYTMSADGTSRIRLPDALSVGDQPAYSRDGSKIVFDSGTDTFTSEIFVVNSDGTGEVQITSNSFFDGDAMWSPDGTKIVFSTERDGNREIYKMNADGSGATRLTNNAGRDDFPSWSPDGAKIVFQTNRDGNFELYAVNVDGSGLTRLTSHPAYDEYPRWSPDGTRILFDTDRDGNFEVYTMNADGTGATRLTNVPGLDGVSAWSPDGTKIAFMSDRDGVGYEIYTMNADGTGQARITNNLIFDADPSWGPRDISK